MNLRVVKVGGSLFDLPGLPGVLRSWLKRQPPAWNVLVAGGGPWAELIRQVDHRYQLGQRPAHWLCVRTLGLTGGLLRTLLPEVDYEDDVARLAATARRATDGSGTILFDVEPRFLKHDAASAGGLPQTWEVTSDSIAARLAMKVQAAELVLLKSANVADASSCTAAAAAGYVDAYFPQACSGLDQVRVVNLRDPDLPEWEWA